MMAKARKMIGLCAAVCASALLAAPASAALTEEQVRSAWSEVARIAEMQELPLSIEQTDTPNAWVTNGESVTVTTGLMAILEREEEIFGVLSHEAGHAKLDHISGRRNNYAVVGVAAVLLGKVIDNSVADVLTGVGAQLAVAGYTREQEVEADDFATDLAFAGGHDPSGLYNALERIILKGGKTQPSGFNSHPPDDRRLGRIERRILERDGSIHLVKVLARDEDGEVVDSEELEYRKERDAEIERWRKELGIQKK